MSLSVGSIISMSRFAVWMGSLKVIVMLSSAMLLGSIVNLMLKLSLKEPVPFMVVEGWRIRMVLSLLRTRSMIIVD